MERIVYNSLLKYFKSLEYVGYIDDLNTNKLLVLTFIHNILYNDYRGYISKEDYFIIEKALNCLFGTCLISYPDYNKMGKLHIGEVSELSHRLCKMNEYATNIEEHLNTSDAVFTNDIIALQDRATSLESRATKLEGRTSNLEGIANEYMPRVQTLESRADATDVWIKNEEDKDMSRDHKIANLEGHTKALQQQADSNTTRISRLETTKVVKSKEDVIVVPDIQL